MIALLHTSLLLDQRKITSTQKYNNQTNRNKPKPFQHKNLHPFPEDPLRNRRRLPTQEERHRDHHPEQVARLLAAQAVPEDAASRHRHPEVGAEVPGAEAAREEKEGRRRHQGFHQRLVTLLPQMFEEVT